MFHVEHYAGLGSEIGILGIVLAILALIAGAVSRARAGRLLAAIRARAKRKLDEADRRAESAAEKEREALDEAARAGAEVREPRPEDADAKTTLAEIARRYPKPPLRAVVLGLLSVALASPVIALEAARARGDGVEPVTVAPCEPRANIDGLVAALEAGEVEVELDASRAIRALETLLDSACSRLAASEVEAGALRRALAARAERLDASEAKVEALTRQVEELEEIVRRKALGRLGWTLGAAGGLGADSSPAALVGACWGFRLR